MYKCTKVGLTPATSDSYAGKLWWLQSTKISIYESSETCLLLENGSTTPINFVDNGQR